MKKAISILIFTTILFSFISLIAIGAYDTNTLLNILVTDAEYDDGYTFVSNKDSLGEYDSFVFLNKTSSNPLVYEMLEDVEYSPHISVSFNIKKDDTVYVWLRAKATQNGVVPNADSIFWSFDECMGVDFTKTTLYSISKEFQWIRIATKNLEAGTHYLNLVGREKYLEISHIRIMDNAKTLVWNGSPYGKPEITPPENTHPRVLVNPETVPMVKANLEHPDNEYFLTLHKMALNYSIDENSTEYNRDHVRKIQSLAFEYLINGDEVSGNEAIRLLKNRLEKVKFASTDDYGTSGKLVYATALVYDWCYDLLGDDKEYFIEKALEISSLYTEMGWPPVNQNGYGGHGSENPVFKDLLALGIAVYDEYKDVYDVTAGRLLEEYIWPRQVYFSAHKSLFGTDYGVHRSKNEITSVLLFKAIGKEDLFGTDEYGKTPYWYIYAKRPDRYFLEDGDGRENHSSGLFGKYSPTYMQMGIASLYGDGYLKAAAKSEMDFRMDKYLNYNIYEEYLETLISNDVNLEEENIEDLNLSYYFPYPSGSYIARTGWGEDSMLVSMKMNELTIRDHNHLDAGGFQIYYKGNLATDSGYYQAIKEGEVPGYYGNYFGDIFHQAYYRQTIAHNCMLIYDPDESDSNFVSSSKEFDFKINTGGQRSNSGDGIDYPSTKEGFYEDEMLNTSKVLAREHNENVVDPDYTYIKGDLKNAYSDKVEEYERTFMFLNLKNKDVPGALIVLDHVVAKDPLFKKTFLLHGVNAPKIDKENNRVTLVRAEKNVGPTSVIKEGYDYNGKLVNDVLLPENPIITQVGESKEDYYVNNVNLKSLGGSNGDEGIAEGGGIRTEISPSDSNKEDYFLNVFQVMDADSPKEQYPVTLIKSSETHIGVSIADRVVMLAENKEKTSSDISFEISGDKCYNISVDGLVSGRWYVYKDGMYLDYCDVTDEGGIAYFSGDAGSYLITGTLKQTQLELTTTAYFYPGATEYMGQNSFLIFGKINGFSHVGEVIDYGIIVNDVNNSEGKEGKFSIKDKGYKPDYNGSVQFGILCYGTGIKNFNPYSYKAYIVYKDKEGEHTVYSEKYYDYVRNLGVYNKYPLTVHVVNE